MIYTNDKDQKEMIDLSQLTDLEIDSFENALMAAVQEEFSTDGPHDKITINSYYEVDEHLIRSEYLLEAIDPT